MASILFAQDKVCCTLGASAPSAMCSAPSNGFYKKIMKMATEIPTHLLILLFCATFVACVVFCGVCKKLCVNCYASVRTPEQYQAGSMPNNKDETRTPEHEPPPPPAMNPAFKKPAFRQASAPEQ
jgi:hypothetical protein